MKYVIYELDEYSESADSYYRYLLLELKFIPIENSHNSLESALSEIERHKDLLKYKKLTIIPVIDISWDGEMN